MKPSLFSRIFGRSELKAAAAMPPPAQPKTKAGAVARPVYLRAANQTAGKLALTDRLVVNKDLTDYRSNASTRTQVRDFSKTLPDMSASVDAYIRTAITKTYKAVAYNMDGSFNKDATNLLQQIITYMDVMKDYSEGFSNISSLLSCSESLAKQLRLYGACALELVLDKSRLPKKLQPISVTTIELHADSKQMWPVQKNSSGDPISLDIPTFFYVSLDQDLDDAYPDIPMEAALQPVLFAQDFMNDIRRVVKKAIHPRLKVTIDAESILTNLPPEVIGKTKETQEYITAIIAGIAEQINGLDPEDALVVLDNVTPEYLTGGSSNLDAEYTTLQGIMDSKVATGTKTLGSVLGHSAGSSNIASTETMLFMKNAEGAVQNKLNELYSQVFTLAVRLFGLDVYVKFAYDPIDLRPDSELEAFKATKQSRILEQLSLGMITDDEACLALTGHPAPNGMKPLSGTMFKSNSGSGQQSNMYSNTSSGDGGGTLNQNLKPETTPNTKGKP